MPSARSASSPLESPSGLPVGSLEPGRRHRRPDQTPPPDRPLGTSSTPHFTWCWGWAGGCWCLRPGGADLVAAPRSAEIRLVPACSVGGRRCSCGRARRRVGRYRGRADTVDHRARRTQAAASPASGCCGLCRSLGGVSRADPGHPYRPRLAAKITARRFDRSWGSTGTSTCACMIGRTETPLRWGPRGRDRASGVGVNHMQADLLGVLERVVHRYRRKRPTHQP